MKFQNKIIPTVIKFGLIGALMNIIALLILFYIGKHPLLLHPFLDARWSLYAIFIFFAIKVFKDQNGKILHLWQGLILGGLVYLIMAQMAAAFIAVFGSIQSTQFLSTYISVAIEQINVNKVALLESNIDEKTIADAIQMLPNTTSNKLAFDYFLKSLPIGLILTLLLSIVMRRTEI